MTEGKKLDVATYAILLAGALAGGFVSGLAGFGTALMALGIWLYILPPAIAVPLVLICSVGSQISTLPSMWKVLDFKLAWPFVAGGLVGMPIGALLVARADPQNFKLSVGVMLLVFPTALYFIRTPMAFRFGGRLGRRSRRICRRHPRRPRRPLRPASDPVGERARLDQGSAARRIPDLQRHRARRRTVPADRQRFRRSRTSSGWRCWRCRER